MPYKNREDRLKYAKEHYKKNSAVYKARTKISNKKIKKFAKNYSNECKSVPCMDCGKQFPPVCMDFDHRDSDKKLFNISDGVQRVMSIMRLKEEIVKCDVVCACCHRLRTQSRADGANPLLA